MKSDKENHGNQDMIYILKWPPLQFLFQKDYHPKVQVAFDYPVKKNIFE